MYGATKEEEDLRKRLEIIA